MNMIHMREEVICADTNVWHVAVTFLPFLQYAMLWLGSSTTTTDRSAFIFLRVVVFLSHMIILTAWFEGFVN